MNAGVLLTLTFLSLSSSELEVPTVPTPTDFDLLTSYQITVTTKSGSPNVYAEEDFDLTVTLVLNDAVFQNPKNAQLRFYFPSVVSTSKVCQFPFYDGVDHGCQSRKSSVKYVSVSEPSSVEFGSNINQTLPVYGGAAIDDEYIEVDFSDLRVISLGKSAAENTVTVKFKSSVLLSTSDWKYNYWITVPGELASEVFLDSLTISQIGPDLYASGIVTSGPSTEVESGDMVGVSLTIGHTSVSTQQAVSNVVRLAFSDLNVGFTLVNNEYDYRIDAGGTVKKNVISDGLQFDVASLNLGSTVTVTFMINATDNLKLHSSIDADLHVDYQAPGQDHDYVTTGGKMISTAQLNMTIHPDDVFFPTKIGVGTTHKIRKTFGMPQGSISLDYIAKFFSNSLDLIPIEFTSSSLSTPSYIEFSDPSLQFVGNDGFTRRKKRHAYEILSREKRAVSQTFNRGAGILTNPVTTGQKNAPIGFEASFQVGNAAQGANMDVSTSLLINGIPIFLTSGFVTLAKPILTVRKSVELVDNTTFPSKVRFNVTVEHDTASNVNADDPTLQDGSYDFETYWRTDWVGPMIGMSGFTVTDDVIFKYTTASLGIGSTWFFSYESKPINGGADLPEGNTTYNASLTYWFKDTSASVTSNAKFQTQGGCCIERKDIVISSLLYNYGFVALGLLCGLLLGIIIVALILVILIVVCRRVPFSRTIYPISDPVDAKKIRETGRGLMIETKVVVKKGFNAIKDFSKTTVDDSIVSILTLKDKLNIHRELDNSDIVSTINVDTNIEEERDQAMVQSTEMLVRMLRNNKDISPQTEEKCISMFKKGLNDLDKNLEKDYQKDMQDIYRRLSAKNREKLSDLLARQEQEVEEMKEKTRNLPEKEKQEMADLLKQQHETEKNELSYLLKLEQDEEAEKLRKEYSIRKRMGVKDQQQQLLEGVKSQGKLTSEQADWLMKEHFKNQASIEKLYDDEISRQRMVLEEKLARRRALAHKTEAQEDFQSETLNTMAQQQKQTIVKMKKEGVLGAAEANEMIEQVQKEMREVKEKIDKDRERQEQDLQKKLSERKKKRLAEQLKKQSSEVSALEKKHASMQSEGCDPLQIIEEKQGMLSQHRSELSDLANEIDGEHATELIELRNKMQGLTEVELGHSKDNLMRKLKHQGMTEDQMEKILAKHEKDLEKIHTTQEEEREKQQANFQKNLAKRRKEWARRREEEKQEQEQLREHEDKVVRKLLDNQVAMSEQERDRIMQEHEKQMVKLENSLTLNKLQQKRMLEEKLAKKRAAQMEKLSRKQQQEIKKQKHAQNDDSDEDEQHHSELDLMKKHAEQKIAILQGENLNIEDEMEEIRESMMKERASALKEQEVQLGALLAQLQMEKAKEMARIEEQQKAIHNLKSNLMDDLNEKGVLSDPECQRVIQIHQAEQEKLNEKLDAQRAKQEKKLQERLHQKLNEREGLLNMQQNVELQENQSANEEALQRRLHERLAQKEASLQRMQDDQVQDSVSAAPSSTAAKLKRVALMHKHVLEKEQFRNRIEKEISQTLEELRRQNDIRRLQASQDQELQFINGLVRLGKFKVSELQNVLQMLFPTKTNEELNSILDRLCEGYEPPPPTPDNLLTPKNLPRKESSLETRVKSSTMKTTPRNDARKGKKGKKKLSTVYDDEDYGSGGKRLSKRPEPVGRSYTPEYNSDNEGRSKIPPSRLPPLKNGTNKKKKKKNIVSSLNED